MIYKYRFSVWGSICEDLRAQGIDLQVDGVDGDEVTLRSSKKLTAQQLDVLAERLGLRTIQAKGRIDEKQC